MIKILYSVVANTFKGYYTSTLFPYISGREYLKQMEVDVQFDYLMTKMEILHFIDEPFKRWVDVRGIVDLVSILKMYENFKNGKEILSDINVSDFLEGIKFIEDNFNRELPYDYICFSTYDAFLFYDILSAFYAKRNNPNIKIILGGSCVTYSEPVSNLLAAFDGIDYVARGDVETSLYHILTGKAEEGVTYFPDLRANEWPVPIHSEEDVKHTANNAVIVDTRGCYQKCSYCVTNYCKPRTAKLDQVFNWIEVNNKDYIHSITFNGPEINRSKLRINKLLDGIIERKLTNMGKFGWFSINHMDEEIVEKMAKCNFQQAIVGIDAISPGLREKVNRKDPGDIKNYLSVFRAMVKRGLKPHAVFIMNFPQETEFDRKAENLFQKIILKELNNTVTVFNTEFLMYPGSPMYEQHENFGIRIEFWKNPNPNLQELDELVSKLPKKYYYEGIK